MQELNYQLLLLAQTDFMILGPRQLYLRVAWNLGPSTLMETIYRSTIIITIMSQHTITSMNQHTTTINQHTITSMSQHTTTTSQDTTTISQDNIITMIQDTIITTK